MRRIDLRSQYESAKTAYFLNFSRVARQAWARRETCGDLAQDRRSFKIATRSLMKLPKRSWGKNWEERGPLYHEEFQRLCGNTHIQTNRPRLNRRA